jgi:hypothetical protein
MFPFACPIASVPNLMGLRFATVFLPLAEGSGRGGNAKAEIADGVKSTNLQRCTVTVVVSPIPHPRRVKKKIETTKSGLQQTLINLHL